ncbi:phosphate ABC transporter substrate-binding protein PstS [Phytohabitans sp. LJ34]|uniref:phosphate ABC transporter substrate-binding protein PstS n=1 Tax=Phytohabitans sp. LJ34 TaxID=3452217 RepID=UPI003F8B667D
MKRTLMAAVATVAIVLGAAPPAAAAPKFVPINGAGSTWSANAIDNWRRNVQQRGIYINYASTGSSDGRAQFRSGTVHFGVSEIPYGLKDAFGGVDAPPSRQYAYMPIVAGGTAFMYNLKIGGRRVTNLRLSGEVVSRIFTGQIKRWNDPAIKADNPGLNLPARAIRPVVRQDGSGTSAQFTLWMSKQHSSIWNAYCRKFNKPAPCGLTSNYPFRASDGFIGQSGSTGVAGYVAQDNAEGSITYVEYSYALNARFPVVKLLNAAGYYIEPTASNVAVALTKARINTNRGTANYLTQILDGVYTSTDKRTYPLSSYSYMLIPVTEGLGVDQDRGYTLSSFANYFLCEGQQQAEVLGYSPLPINLVDAGMQQVKRIPGAPKSSIVIANCNNPTFSRSGANTLVQNAKQPSDCDRKGPRQNPEGTAGARNVATPVVASARCAGSGGGNNTNNNGATTAPTAPGANPTASAGAVDPDTGLPAGDGAGAGDGEQVAAVPVALDGEGGWRMRHTMMLIAGVLLVGLVLGPPFLAASLRGRRDRQERT